MKKSTPILALSAILILFFALASCHPGSGGSSATTTTTNTDSLKGAGVVAGTGVHPQAGGPCTYVPAKSDITINAVTDITFTFDLTAGTVTITDTAAPAKCITVIPADTVRSWYTYTDASSRLHFVDSPSVHTLNSTDAFRWLEGGSPATTFTLGTEGGCNISVGNGDLRNDFKCPANAHTLHLNINNTGNDHIPNYVTGMVTKSGATFLFYVAQSNYPNIGTTPPTDAGICPVSVTKVCP
jgi:hypothetical protein